MAAQNKAKPTLSKEAAGSCCRAQIEAINVVAQQRHSAGLSQGILCNLDARQSCSGPNSAKPEHPSVQQFHNHSNVARLNAQSPLVSTTSASLSSNKWTPGIAYSTSNAHFESWRRAWGVMCAHAWCTQQSFGISKSKKRGLIPPIGVRLL